jgi:hypothetical protein
MLNRAIFIGFIFSTSIIPQVLARDEFNVWCKRIDVRKMIIESLNNTNAAKAAGASIIDLSGGKNISWSETPYKVVCQYDLTASDGDAFVSQVTITKNSLGDVIVKVEQAPEKK